MTFRRAALQKGTVIRACPRLATSIRAVQKFLFEAAGTSHTHGRAGLGPACASRHLHSLCAAAQSTSRARTAHRAASGDSASAMAAPPQQLPPQEMQVDRFMVYTQAIIGTGGFGQVFKARDSQTNEIVAAKVIDLRRVRREKIMDEIRLMELVAEHPSFIGLRGAQEVADHFKIFIFMELAPGGELFERVITMK